MKVSIFLGKGTVMLGEAIALSQGLKALDIVLNGGSVAFDQKYMILNEDELRRTCPGRGMRY